MALSQSKPPNLMGTTADDMIAASRNWLEHFIIHHGICPFAAPVYRNDQVDFYVVSESEIEPLVIDIMGQVQRLIASPKPETLLLIIPSVRKDYEAFLDIVYLCNQLIAQQGLQQQFQFASFHPDYLFAEEDPDDLSHYTNRAPWPILHLIRQDSISKALEHYPDPENIPERNKQLMQQLGRDYLQQMLSNCSKR